MASSLDREAAEEYAVWFRCLADATRLQILHLLATCHRPMQVGEITAAVEVGQSTVSAHLKRLREDGFVFVDRVATASLHRVNPECLAALPSAVETIMATSEHVSARDA